MTATRQQARSPNKDVEGLRLYRDLKASQSALSLSSKRDQQELYPRIRFVRKHPKEQLTPDELQLEGDVGAVHSYFSEKMRLNPKRLQPLRLDTGTPLSRGRSSGRGSRAISPHRAHTSQGLRIDSMQSGTPTYINRAHTSHSTGGGSSFPSSPHSHTPEYMSITFPSSPHSTTHSSQRAQSPQRGECWDALEAEEGAELELGQKRMEEHRTFFSKFKKIASVEVLKDGPGSSLSPAGSATLSNQITPRQQFLQFCVQRHLVPEPIAIRGQETLSLPHYGVGDNLATALAESVSNSKDLRVVNLSDNRLSDGAVAKCLRLLGGLPNLESMDLSHNTIGKKSCEAFQSMGHSNPQTKEVYLSHAGIGELGFGTLVSFFSSAIHIRALDLGHNRLSSNGISLLSEWLSMSTSVEWLNLSWNAGSTKGAVAFSGALARNESLKYLNISHNNIGDEGGEYLAHSLFSNKSLEILNCQNNDLSYRSAQVFAKALRANTVLKELHVEGNPFTEMGGRALMRAVVKGIHPCVLHLSHCTFEDEPISKQEGFDPLRLRKQFEMDLSRPYDACVTREMIRVSSYVRGVTLSGLSVRQPGKKGKKGIKLQRLMNETHGRELVDATTSRAWMVPNMGILTYKCNHKHSRPVPNEDAISEEGLDNLIAMALQGADNGHLGKILHLLLLDVFMFTEQAQKIVDSLKRCMDFDIRMVVSRLLHTLLDRERVGQFCGNNLNDGMKRQLIHHEGFDVYKFNYNNPTGRWKLDLSNRECRWIASQFGIINGEEQDHSKTQSGRGDTSQHGNWTNFRNEKYKGLPFVLTTIFFEDLPHEGRLEFDYVMTMPPTRCRHTVCSKSFKPSMRSRQSSGNIKRVFANTLLEKAGFVVTSASFTKMSEADIRYATLDFHHVVSTAQLTTEYVPFFIDVFPESMSATRVDILVSLFSRLTDKYNFDQIIKIIPTKELNAFVQRIGWLNCASTIYVGFNYVLKFQYADECKMLRLLMDFADADEGDSITENFQENEYDMRELVPLVSFPEEGQFAFTYSSSGGYVNWKARLAKVASFLSGSQVGIPKLRQRIEANMAKDAAAREAAKAAAKGTPKIAARETGKLETANAIL
jgi:Ran GTPase-activating protein (RanGAP) involved in mRNA processing and transport